MGMTQLFSAPHRSRRDGPAHTSKLARGRLWPTQCTATVQKTGRWHRRPGALGSSVPGRRCWLGDTQAEALLICLFLSFLLSGSPKFILVLKPGPPRGANCPAGPSALSCLQASAWRDPPPRWLSGVTCIAGRPLQVPVTPQIMSRPQSRCLSLLPFTLSSSLSAPVKERLSDFFGKEVNTKRAFGLSTPTGSQKAADEVLRVVSPMSAHSPVWKCCSGFEVPDHRTELLTAEFSELSLKAGPCCHSAGSVTVGRGPHLCTTEYTHLLCWSLNASYNSLPANVESPSPLGPIKQTEHFPVKETGASCYFDQGSANHSLRAKSNPLPVFISKVSLGCAHSLMHGLSCWLHTPWRGGIVAKETVWPQMPEIFTL